MTEKQKKTEAELKTIIMQEIGKHPKCRNIQNVVIAPSARPSSYLPNWSVSWVVDDAAPRPADADEIVQKLQRQFDLS
jgi:hypothetical protein